jgi:hypothetical protein
VRGIDPGQKRIRTGRPEPMSRLISRITIRILRSSTKGNKRPINIKKEQRPLPRTAHARTITQPLTFCRRRSPSDRPPVSPLKHRHTADRSRGSTVRYTPIGQAHHVQRQATVRHQLTTVETSPHCAGK